MNKTPAERLEYLLNLAVAIAGGWQATGCKDEALEREFNRVLNQIHPKREIALKALEIHIAGDVAA